VRIRNLSIMTAARKLSVVIDDREPFEVVIAGGGVAALEAALALRELGGGRMTLTLIAANTEFVYRPMAVIEPFRYPPAQRFPLAEIARDIGAELMHDRLAAVAPSERVVQTDSGVPRRYDALVLGIGGRIRVRYEHAITLEDDRSYQRLRRLIEDVESGSVRHLAFVVPPRLAWPLPVYELALFTARHASERGVELAITILTPENAPLAVFGDGVSRGVSQLLADRGIEVITSAQCEVPGIGQVEIASSNRQLEVDCVVALPELDGPAVPGLPEAPDGFIPVNDHCQVPGVERVYAAGDATDFGMKYGGIAAQQADTAAQAIAALAGAPVEPETFNPVVHGLLLTGTLPRYLRAGFTVGQAFASEITVQPTWTPPAKIAAKYLAPYLDHTFGSGPGRPGSPT
jgi:sulfide:quinone oxidoreductase